MGAVEFVALLLAGVGPVLALARWLRLPPTIALFGAGLAAGLIPGPAPMSVDPDLAIGLFLPPIIYAGTVRATPQLLRHVLLPGVITGVAVALTTILAVAGSAHWVLLPGLSWTGAVLLGVTASLFDTRLFQEADAHPHVPRTLADALKAREMASRIVALTALALALSTLRQNEAPAFGEAALTISWQWLGSALAGMAIGRSVLWLRDRAGPAPIEIAVSLATPYLGALAARGLDLSLAVVVIAAALTVSAARVNRETGEARSSAEARISAMAFWEEASLLLSSVLFFLAGLGLPGAVGELGSWPVWRAVAAVAGILALVLGIQWVGSLASTRLPPLRQALAEEGVSGRMTAAGVMAWASTRSVIGLVVVLSVPAAWPDGRPFAERELLLVVASGVILGSVLLQGLTLRRIIQGAKLSGRGQAKREEDRARQVATDARHEVGKDAVHPEGLAAERRALLGLREHDELGDEALRRLLREADLRKRASESDASPGAAPPNP
ncbi:cation:proton antiporter domain-containing protein [Belnapia rosea]|uniref:NhaP-type Na+/H+ or K+/H+ antiporter n=1 Tax=Belnapia rosea TaxID=938405 RepID=A0A1G6JZT5_9PROT|nr:cation:proton antiporter [Belnapia rosea]SDC24292.1 NhaP-type Na+/H+ or K+/H+ antiporter [Belnapia rosea]